MTSTRTLNRTLLTSLCLLLSCTSILLPGSLFSVAGVHAAPKADRPGRSSAPRDLQSDLDAILEVSGQSKLTYAGRVIELPSGRVIYDHNGKAPLMPASCMKLITIAAAIDHLGPGFQFQTTCAIRGKDLVVIGAGDPTIGDERLARSRGESITAVFANWAARLKTAGVQQIPGDIVIDDSIFDRQFVNPNWPPEQFQEWYEAPVGGLNFNANCVDIRVTPGKPGKPATVTLVPGNTALSIINQTITGSRHAPSARRKPGTDSIVVSGPVARTTQLGPITIQDPGLYFGSILKTVLASQGIKIGGNVRREKVSLDSAGRPIDGHIVGVLKTPLADAMARAGKQSLGMMAETLMKLLGARAGGTGSWTSGRAAVESFLQKVGAAPDQFKIDEGSGLSRYNRLSPAVATQTLQYIFSGPPQRFAALRQSLSVAGIDGTLEKRMKDPATKGRIFAKTGYINGVRTLAGYIHTRNDQWLAFAFFYNNAAATRPLSNAQDKACRLLVDWPGDSKITQSREAGE
jgi:D-alanyl-D-alanine carboxypeptidase/D-alanyl-D-alanine-endopeptidase (penicillin-binding protein 4)